MRKVLFILGQLNDNDIEWLATHGKTVKLPKGTEVIKFGTRIDALYIILDGSMRVLTAKGALLATVATGDILGEMSLIDSGLTAASVVVEQDAAALAISKQLLLAKLAEDVGFGARFYRALALFLANRMRNTISRMGYGKDEPMDAGVDADELESDVLDNVHLAGARFDRMLQRLAG